MKTVRRVMLGLPLFLAHAPNFFGQSPATSSATVATVAGQPVSEQELLETLGSQQVMQMRTQEYETKSKALESLIRLKLVQAEARKRGVSAEKLIEQEVESKMADPTDGEVEAFLLGQGRVAGRFDEVKDQYRGALKQLKLQKARQAYADSLRAQIDVAVLLRPPAVDIPYDPARVRGDPKAPVTIVEFSDFQCPFCQKSVATVKAVLAKYQGRVKLAFLDFPLAEIHPRAQTAAEAARCAGEQGKFWEYHDTLFEDQSKLDESSLVGRAKSLKMDETAFQSCLASGRFKTDIEANREQGVKAGVAGTPGFFINGVFLSGAQPQAEFEKIIDSELAFLGNQRGPQ